MVVWWPAMSGVFVDYKKLLNLIIRLQVTIDRRPNVGFLNTVQAYTDSPIIFTLRCKLKHIRNHVRNVQKTAVRDCMNWPIKLVSVVAHSLVVHQKDLMCTTMLAYKLPVCNTFRFICALCLCFCWMKHYSTETNRV